MMKAQWKYSRSEDWASNRNESAVELRVAIRSSDDVFRCQKSDFGASSDVAIRYWGNKHWESLWEDHVSDAYTQYAMYGTNLP